VTYAAVVPTSPRQSTSGRGLRILGALSAVLLATCCLACGTNSTSSSSTAASGMSVTVITPNVDQDYFKSVQADALDEGAAQGVAITQVTDAADEVSQIKAVQAAIDSGATGIVIFPAGAAVAGSVQKARDAGLIVIELGGSPNPTGQANLVIGADDCTLGTAIGQWVAGKLNSYPGNIARVTGPLTPNNPPPAGNCRDTAFLQGMGIETGDPNTQGDEPTAGRYTGGYAGDFTLPCLVTTAIDADTARAGLADCFATGAPIDTVYAASDALAEGAAVAMRYAGKTIGTDSMLAAVGGNRASLDMVKGGLMGAVATPRFPGLGNLAITSITGIAKGGAPPVPANDKGYVDIGVDICTDYPQSAVTVAIQVPVQECLDRLR